jgi:hypothetical protein
MKKLLESTAREYAKLPYFADVILNTIDDQDEAREMIKAILEYKDQAYDSINGALRKGKEFDHEEIALIDKAFGIAEIFPNNVTVYRKLYYLDQKFIDNSFKPGNVFLEKGYLSTMFTPRGSYHQSSSGETLMEIEIPARTQYLRLDSNAKTYRYSDVDLNARKNIRGLSRKELDNYPTSLGELEVLFPRNGLIKILDSKGKYNQYDKHGNKYIEPRLEKLNIKAQLRYEN